MNQRQRELSKNVDCDLSKVSTSGDMLVGSRGLIHGKRAVDDRIKPLRCDGCCGVSQIRNRPRVVSLQTQALLHHRAVLDRSAGNRHDSPVKASLRFSLKALE